MSKSPDRSTPRVRRFANRRTQKTRPLVEALEGRTLLTLNFTAAYNIQGSGVAVNQAAIDVNGNAYITGDYQGTATFGKDAGGNSVTKNNSGNLEGFVVEYSPTGVVEWYTQFENQGDPQSTSTADSVAYDAANQTVYVVGNFTGQVDFDPFGVGDIETSSVDSSSGSDALDNYIVGLSASTGHESNQLFDDFIPTDSSTTFATNSQLIVNSTATPPSVYVTGYYSGGPITVSSSNKSVALVSPPTSTEGFTAKFNQNLALQWAANTTNASGGTLDDSENFGIAVSDQQGIDYVVGVDSDGGTAFVEVLNDTDGSWITTDDITTTASARATAVVTDSAGNAYVVGSFAGNLTPDINQAPLVSNGNQNAFMVAFDSSLNELWENRFGSENNDSADDVAIDGTGNLYISGEDGGPSSFGTSTTAVLRGNDTTSNDEAYVIEVSSAGNFLGGAQAVATGGTAFSDANYLAVNAADKVAVAGTLQGQGTFGKTTLTSAAEGNFIGSVAPTPKPAITWANPANITPGTALSSVQLDATATVNGASVAGTFVYKTATGTVLTIGSVLPAGTGQVLTATFTPTDTTDYTIATGTATINVVAAQATPAITWANPANITYGTALGASQLDATASVNGANVAGKFTYSPATGALPKAGTETLRVTFTPTDTTDYTSASATATHIVAQATPTVTWANPPTITAGTALSSAQLDATASIEWNGMEWNGMEWNGMEWNGMEWNGMEWNGMEWNGMEWKKPPTNVAGKFTYKTATDTVLTIGSVLPAGTGQVLTATFTPTDTTDYTTATGTATINVVAAQATPAINWANPPTITYGTALGVSQLDATATVNGANVAGKFTYNPVAGTVLGAGNQTLAVTFTPTDTTDYTSASGTVTLAVAQATPTITWANPPSIGYGTALGASQLDATASVPGYFTYSPAAGTVLGAGNQTLAVTFTPNDSLDYASVSTTTAINVAQPVPPVFLGEQRVYSGKGKHQKVTGFRFSFDSALNAGGAQSTGDYHVTQKIGRKVKVLPVNSAAYNPGNFSVTISVGGFKIGKPAQVTIAGLVGANGAAISQIASGL